jgi:murein DD-endopeptidase MepM/ murein hydrolase activator NlpD
MSHEWSRAPARTGRTTSSPKLAISLALIGLLSVILPASPVRAAAESVPGGIYLHPLPPGVEQVTYRGIPVLIFNQVALVGIHLGAEPGVHRIRVHHADGSVEDRHFAVEAKQYTEQHLTIANPKMVNPDPEDLTRIREESSRMRAQYELFTRELGSPMPFVQPVPGPLSSSFGRRRVLNGEPRSPHSGLDIAAPSGTPIESPAPGVVTLTGDFYFNGNTVFVDHGQGLITMICHLSRIDVAEGDRVDRGDVLGLVGATGRVTGPHLHWSVSMNGNRVDPVQLMGIFTESPADL